MLPKHALAAAAMLLSLAVALPASAECKLTKVADIPVQMRGLEPLVEGTINGEKVAFLLDTGAWYSVLTAEAADKLGLKHGGGLGIRSIGVGGEHSNDTTKAKELRIGNVVTSDTDFVVYGGRLGEGISGLLSPVFFAGYDVEFDLAHGQLRMFQAEGCDKNPLAYWSNSYSVARIKPTSKAIRQIWAEVKINGKPVTAMFDTGAPTALSLQSAARAGVGPTTQGAVEAQPVNGLGRGPSVNSWIAPFDSFVLGDETIQKPRLLIADMNQNMPEEVATGSHVRSKTAQIDDMLIGIDFFQSHRIYVAYDQDRMYFTYNGGPVFRPGETPAASAAK